MVSNIKRFINIWWIAIRPFAFPASIIPVVYGSVLSCRVNNLNLNFYILFLCLISIISIHASCNMLSDIADNRKDIDKVVLPGSGALVRKLLNIRQLYVASFLLLFLGILAGSIVSFYTSYYILVLGVVGVILGVEYSFPPLKLKYTYLGDTVILFNFGVLAFCGAWITQSNGFSSQCLFFSLPIAFSPVAILHANNWRDISIDTEKQSFTFASKLNLKQRKNYYLFLISSCIFFTLCNLFFFEDYPKSQILVVLSLLFMYPTFKKIISSKDLSYLKTLDIESAKLSMISGILLIIGAII